MVRRLSCTAQTLYHSFMLAAHCKNIFATIVIFSYICVTKKLNQYRYEKTTTTYRVPNDAHVA